MKSFLHYVTLPLLIVLVCSSLLSSQNVSELSVVVEFDSPPTAGTVLHTPLRYDKDFALSFTMDDGAKETFTHAFKYLNGGTIDGTSYPQKVFTDGCGNDIPFTMSTAIFSMNGSADVHEAGTDFARLYLTWAEISELYSNGWGISNHGLTTSIAGDPNYSIAKNHSYIKCNTTDAVSGGIDASIFVNPNGSEPFSAPAFSLGYNAAYRQYSYGVDYLNVNNTSQIVDLQQLKMGRRELSGSTSMADIADALYAAASQTVTPWSATFNHSINGGAGYTFTTFKSYIDYISSTYGKEGLDNIWFTGEEGILDYLLVKDAIDISTSISGNELTILFSGTLPVDLRTYAVSLLVKSNDSNTIRSISVNGGATSSNSGLNSESALINLEWDGNTAPSVTSVATHYVDSAVHTNSETVAAIALDYVTILDEGSTKTQLLRSLNSIDGVEISDIDEECSFSLGNDTAICLGSSLTFSAPDSQTTYAWSTSESTQTITVDPNITTEYFVETTDSNGCIGRDTINVNVRALPSITISSDFESCKGQCINIFASGGETYSWSNGIETSINQVCPTTDTVYVVEVTDDIGCQAKDSVSITIKESQELQISGLLRSYCEGASASLVEAIPEGGTFEGTGIVGTIFSPTTAGVGTHRISYTVESNGCILTDTFNVKINPNPVIILPTDTIVCADEIVELNAGGEGGYDEYLWSNGSRSPTHFQDSTGTGIGTKTLDLVVTEKGCASFHTIDIHFISCITGVEDLESSGIMIYPVPTKGNLSINLVGRSEDITLKLINLHGQVVHTEILEACGLLNCNKSVDLHHLDKGLYIIQFSDSEIVSTGKLFIH